MCVCSGVAVEQELELEPEPETSALGSADAMENTGSEKLPLLVGVPADAGASGSGGEVRNGVCGGMRGERGNRSWSIELGWMDGWMVGGAAGAAVSEQPALLRAVSDCDPRAGHHRPWRCVRRAE